MSSEAVLVTVSGTVATITLNRPNVHNAFDDALIAELTAALAACDADAAVGAVMPCCDVAIGVDGAKFSLSEVKLGLVPAVISPYVIAAIGLRQARRLFVGGEVFDAATAARIGLLHDSVPPAELDEAVGRTLHFFAKGGPVAQTEAKKLALRIGGMTPESAERVDHENAALIARLRVSEEGQHGLGAFLDKRAPDWV